MELKYDIYMLNNAQGTGEKRQYIRIVQHEPMTEKQLQEKIQSRCSLTKGDVAAVLATRPASAPLKVRETSGLP